MDIFAPRVPKVQVNVLFFQGSDANKFLKIVTSGIKILLHRSKGME